MPRIAIIGGGLAGMSCAVALAGCGVEVELFESRRKLGGRAGSFVDRTTGETIDHCQHVAMGCCTNFGDFCSRTGIEGLFVRQKRLHFFGPDGERSDFTPSSWLPAPLHLAGPLLGLKYLSLADKFSIARCLLVLTRTPVDDAADGPTVLAWLNRQGQSGETIDRFWKVVLVSALAESLDRASLAAARKVFVDGFMTHREASSILVPTVSLDELYQNRVRGWLVERGIHVHLETPVEGVVGGCDGIRGLRMPNESIRGFDFVVVAVPWTRMSRVLAPEMMTVIDPSGQLAAIPAAPISSAHLWFDRPITELPNAVLVDRLSQWVFTRTIAGDGNEHYYQVVISASYDLAGREKQAVIEAILKDLSVVFPEAARARLLRAKLLTEDQAVFSVRPGLDAIRPSQQTVIPNLVLAGDWTHTGWPATMEGAVRSGYLAAEAVLKSLGQPARLVVPDLPRNWLTRNL
jgi:squalene-associated FAD-dependent desaturase